ncbi:hypothetical protein ABAC402_00595 [Asticcacaulis sp. AC402]|nr:hypothetical protein ABAC402_00595 [Asticcacaulis sp. AC402]
MADAGMNRFNPRRGKTARRGVISRFFDLRQGGPEQMG